MQPLQPTAGDKAARVIQIVLGALFVYAAAGKIMDPGAFAAIVANYRVLPESLSAATAVVLPWVEVICGLALISGRLEKGAALLVTSMMVVFIGLILYNGYRGLNVACGCFSLAAKAPSSMALNITRNLVLLAAGAWLLLRPQRRRRAASP